MKNKIPGKVAYVFGNNINTDAIQPPRYFSNDPHENAKGLFKGINEPDFPEQINEGDIFVAGKNFGCGSSRETVVQAIIYGGVGAIIAESYGRIFYRNLINNAFIPIQIEDMSMIKEGDLIDIDYRKNKIRINNEKEIEFKLKLSDTVKEIIAAGGLLKKLENEL